MNLSGSRLSTPILPSRSDPDFPTQTTLYLARRVWRAIQRISPSPMPSSRISCAPRLDTSQVHAARTLLGSFCGEILTGSTTVTRLSLRNGDKLRPTDICNITPGGDLAPIQPSY